MLTIDCFYSLDPVASKHFWPGLTSSRLRCSRGVHVARRPLNAADLINTLRRRSHLKRWGDATGAISEFGRCPKDR